MKTITVEGETYAAVDEANGYVKSNLSAVCAMIMEETDAYAFEDLDTMRQFLSGYSAAGIAEVIGEKLVDEIRASAPQQTNPNECSVQITNESGHVFEIVARKVVLDDGNQKMVVRHVSPNGNAMLEIGPLGVALYPSYLGLAAHRGRVRVFHADTGAVLKPDGDGVIPINDALLKELNATAMWSGETVRLTAAGHGVEEANTIAEAAAELLSTVHQEK